MKEHRKFGSGSERTVCDDPGVAVGPGVFSESERKRGRRENTKHSKRRQVIGGRRTNAGRRRQSLSPIFAPEIGRTHFRYREKWTTLRIYSFGRYFECRGQRVLTSGYLGSIGFAFPAAMGAWAATQVQADYQGRKVISVSGDGGFGQYMAEFTTAVQYEMDICHVLLNNAELGKISKEQRAGQWPVWQTRLRNPNFAAYAESS